MVIQRYQRWLPARTGARPALLVACAAQLLVVVDISVVNVALPSIQAELAMSQRAAPWVAMAYTLGFGGALLVGARLADVLGTARVLAGGVVAFTAASLAGGLAPAAGVLIGARAVQGIAAAVVAPATFTLITRCYPEGPDRVRALAWWTAVSVAGGGVGNISSGLLTDLLSWRAVLLVNVPVGLWVARRAQLFSGADPEPGTSSRLGLTGAVLAIAASSGATLALSFAGRPSAIPIGALTAACIVALVLQQRRTSVPLVPFALLRSRTILLGNAATVLTAMAFQVALWYFLTFRMQEQLGYTALQAGLAFLPLTATMVIVTMRITPWLVRRWSAGAVVTLGGAVAAVGLALQAQAPEQPFLLAVLLPTVVIGVGGGLVSTPLATIVTTGIAPVHAGAASGLMNTGKQLGGAVGLAVGTVAASALGTDAAAFVLMAALLVLVALLGLRVVTLAPAAAPGGADRSEPGEAKPGELKPGRPRQGQSESAEES